MIEQYISKDIDYFIDSFPEVRNLILSSDYVSSCNFSMNFFPIALNADDEIGMSQRIPISAYLCVKRTTHKHITFDDSIFYDAYTDTVSNTHRKSYRKKIDHLSNYIMNYLSQYDCDTGWSINMFMERDRNVGFGSKSFWSVMLAYRLLLQTGQLTTHIRDKDNKEAVLEIVKEIYKVVGREEFKRGTFVAPLWYEDHYGPICFVDNVFSQHKSLGDNQLPVDIIILNFGSEFDRNITMRSIEDFHAMMNRYCYELHTPYSKSYLSKFAYCLKVEFIYTYKKLLSNAMNEISLQELMNTIDHMNSFAKVIEGPNYIIDHIKNIIKQLQQFDSEYIGVLPLTSNQNSDNIILIANRTKSRHTLGKIVDTLYNTYPCVIEYVSRLDHQYKKGIQIEHRPSCDIVLSKSKEYDCVIYKMDGSSIVSKYRDVYLAYSDYLIVDSIADKIYYDGKNIDSKVLPSQTYTISLLSSLWNSINQWIGNTSLEASAYSKSMNQLSGKIIGPIRKLTQELFGTSIDIQVTGNIYNYDIKLQASDHKIIYINKK